ncbi:unnamed protein product [Spirodela intermedia]|uniref:Uncharacterized protein n=1 Tax=Spirodela intermedia TaxID=51605 RepID=A0A7I8LIY2_SPIIN|nr:unnamed protein product [Spirodela intermedia]
MIEALGNKREERQLPSQLIENPRPNNKILARGVYLPLLTTIEHIPEYGIVLKEMCTPKKTPRVEKLSMHASALLLNQLPYKLRDTSAPLISCDIGGSIFQNALLDTGVSINLLSTSICDKFNITDLKPSIVTLQFVDRSIKHPKGIVEDVIVIVIGYKFPTDFVVLEIDFNGQFDNTPIILGRPFLYTLKMNIDFLIGITKISCEDQLVEIKIFEVANDLKKSQVYDCHIIDLLDDFDDPYVIDDCVLEELEEIKNINLGERKRKII